MEISTPTYTYKELTGATRLLENMRDNCIKKDTDTYDDPDRERKYEALNIAIDAIKKLPVTKRAMISQPMAGKKDEEIKATREKAIAALKEKGYEIVNTLFTDEWYSNKAMKERGVVQIPLCFLAKSLENMSLCHAAYFCKNWKNARGCRIEHDAAVAYGLDIIYEED